MLLHCDYKKLWENKANAVTIAIAMPLRRAHISNITAEIAVADSNFKPWLMIDIKSMNMG